MKNARFEMLRVRLLKNSILKSQLKPQSVPESIRLGLMVKSKIYYDTLYHIIVWITGMSAFPALLTDLGGNFHQVKLVTYCGLIDSRLAPDVKAENVNQS